MKIALPSKDGETIFPHFGRTPKFAVIQVENDQVVDKSMIENNITGHGMGRHRHGVDDAHSHHHGEGHHRHSHDGILSAFHDVDVVIANGAGRRLVEDIKRSGKKMFMTSEREIDKAVQLFLRGDLKHEPDIGCGN